MFKNLFNGVSLASLMLRDAENEGGTPDPKVALREKLAKGNIAPAAEAVIPDTTEGDDADPEEEEEEDEGEEEAEVDPPVEETAEQKKDREAKEKIEAKAKRKDERMQRRIDNAVAEREAAKTEIARLKAQLEANPDKKLTPEEIETRAEAIAAKKVADKQLADIQTAFVESCDKLQAEAKKVDKDFDTKIGDIAADLGPIPSFMIGVLDDFDNGGEVLAFIAGDDEVAEKIWSLSKSPAKMTKALVDISNKLAEAKKPAKKQISKVPDPITPVKGSRVVSNVITEADTKDMDRYIAKRQAQMAEQRKLKGF